MRFCGWKVEFYPGSEVELVFKNIDSHDQNKHVVKFYDQDNLKYVDPEVYASAVNYTRWKIVTVKTRYDSSIQATILEFRREE